VAWRREARTSIERQGARRALELRAQIGEEIRRAREDAGLSQRRLARLAGISSSTLHDLEVARHDPTIETLTRLGAALGMDLGIRLFVGTGPLVRDHISGAMIGVLVGQLHGSWRPTPEVALRRPVRGVIDLVLDRADPPIVACEAHSDLRRIEQQIRWARTKADALGEARRAEVSRLLLLRSTARTRAIAREFQPFLAAAYPARVADAYAALTGEAAWPGDALLWCRVNAGVATVLDRPPRGINVGR
jgi:transcriptional regulator with XRE-family HTH domain